MPEIKISLDLTTIILSLVGIVSSALIAQLTRFLTALAEKSKQANKFDKLDKYIDVAKNTILDTVKAVNYSVVNDLKAKAADGKLTDEEKNQVISDAVATVLSSLSDKAHTTLNTVYGDLPTWVRVQIEKTVAEEKKNKDGSGVDSLCILKTAPGLGENTDTTMCPDAVCNTESVKVVEKIAADEAAAGTKVPETVIINAGPVG